MNKLILIEGIPGSGKTTLSNKLKTYLEEKRKKVILYNEGELHPADLAWISCVPIEEYKFLIKDYEEYKTVLAEHTTFDEEYAYIAYTKLGLYPGQNGLIKYLSEKEIFDGKVPLETFKKLLINRWKEFAKSVNEDTVTIFECVYFQNHINELLLFHNKDIDFILPYMVELINTVRKLNPKLIYLSQTNVFETISRVASERKTDDPSKYKDWIDLVIPIIEESPYGMKHGFTGFDGVIQYFEDRKKIELEVIKELPIDTVIINNDDYNWDQVLKDMIEALDPIKALIHYIDYFKDEKSKLVKWVTPKSEKEGVYTFSYPEYLPKFHVFIDLFNQTNLIEVDYLDIIEEKRIQFNEIKKEIEKADLKTLRALFTFYIRQERFNEGLWSKAIKEDIFLQLLLRLEVLLKEIKG